MKILHVTDTHLGARRAVRGAPRGWSRADDHLAAFRWALAFGEREEVDLVVHSGDLFDRSAPPARAVTEAFDLLVDAARRVPVVVIPGNHDRRGLRRWLPHRGLEVHDRPTRLAVRGLALGLVPFVRTAEAFAAAARSVTGPGIDLLVAHQAFDGARVPGLEFRADRRDDTVGEAHLPGGVSHVACGHLHPRQVVTVGGAEVVQPGATERTSWTERHERKGVALWTAGAQLAWRFVDAPTRPMVDVRGPEDLDRVTPGCLVRVGDVPEEEVLRRGGWLVGPPPGGRPTRPDPGSPPVDLLPFRAARPSPRPPPGATPRPGSAGTSPGRRGPG